ncbi:hypothetical protein PR202_ga21410 [Eleusine coracana subsp. coracana]|uniref:Uncharacterized protein n=1 Tax=Eleusine coracana subsp. coracana TaxID=191504 RepID=A0AAV5CZ27_ELECO|nr:hypothetical protein PR202_ga21410 [Eleusine coracana subsp. coracana]
MGSHFLLSLSACLLRQPDALLRAGGESRSSTASGRAPPPNLVDWAPSGVAPWGHRPWGHHRSRPEAGAVARKEEEAGAGWQGRRRRSARWRRLTSSSPSSAPEHACRSPAPCSACLPSRLTGGHRLEAREGGAGPRRGPEPVRLRLRPRASVSAL